MAAAAMLEIQVHAIKWAIIHPILMKFGTQTKTDMLSSKITKAEVYGHFSRWQPTPFRKIDKRV
jgi:hypothetical protein